MQMIIVRYWYIYPSTMWTMDNTTIDTKTCQHCQSSFDITQSDLDFYDKISPSFAGHKFQIPTPTLCPDCRQRRRLSFRNERKLYRRQCDASQKSIISIYSPNKPYTVYDQSIWWSDSRDAMDYGCEFDFTRTFTEQFGDLMKKVPRMSSLVFQNENCDYNSWIANSKNCYMCSAARYLENCYYINWWYRCSSLIDCLKVTDCESTYNTVNSEKCNNCIDIINCSSCHHCYNCANLIWCYECIDCDHLENKSYCIANKQYSKEEYFSLKQKTINSSKKILSLSSKKNLNAEWCIGYYINNSSNIIDWLDVEWSTESKFVMSVISTHHSYDVSISWIDQFSYEVSSGEEHYNIWFCNITQWINNSYYCDSCFEWIKNCFGCIWLRNKQYCIFNRQYENKEKYEEQVAKIIQHMMTTWERGEFFHPSLSPFGYNETVAQEYYPVTLTDDGQMIDQRIDSEDVKSSDRSSEISSANLQIQGYKRSSYEAPTPQVDKVIKWQDLPDTITDVTDDILKVAIQCEVSNKLFRIIPQELIFYRKHNISLPRKHPDVRHLERMALRR